MKILTPQILAMYLGCNVRCIVDTDTELAVLTGVCSDGYLYFENNNEVPDGSIDALKARPILRNLSSMTEDEAMELFDIVVGPWDGGVIKSRRLATSIEVCCYDIEEDDNPSDDEIFELADSAENLMRIELKPTFNIWKGWERDYNEVYEIKTQFAAFYHLLRKGFDLFGLIGSGLAIDKDVLK